MKIGKQNFAFNRTFIMGILNITPDSFFSNSRVIPIEALAAAKKMIEEGADIIDIGGESTRPGFEAISVEEELKRIVPALIELKNNVDTPISIDTYKASVAEKVIIEGADLINDIWGLKEDPKMAEVISRYGVSCCLMHNRKVAKYRNLIEDIIMDLKESIKIALNAGIKKDKIILDPGIGFAKSYEENLIVLRNLKRFKELGFPLLLGTSRKSVIGLTLDLPVEERLSGTLATTTLAISAGFDFVRVHDVKENKRTAQMADKICR
ncbi:MAG: dihydropteroate synthase [Erysipelotrichales bacterium]|nr:dihydropteroate synthase [Erysipelotrichales bacterium]